MEIRNNPAEQFQGKLEFLPLRKGICTCRVKAFSTPPVICEE
jgi:hypothetical protein